MDKSGSGYQAASRKPNGCILASKGTNRDRNGYVQIAPISTRTRGSASTSSAKPLPQNAHRLVVIASQSPEDRRKLLEEPSHASHLCHEPRCIAKDHIVVESKDLNEARKDCEGNYLAGWAECAEGWKVVFESTFACTHNPPCFRRAIYGESKA